ncbi:MAG: aminopeptidase P family protein [Geminicoccaceae bacterium]
MTAAHAARLAAVRKVLAERGVDGFFLPRTDEHGSEYLPADAERVAWLTGFTGSAGQVVVLMDKAAVFSDGRYTVQLAAQVDEALFERRHSIEQPASKWIEEHLPEGGRLGYDPFLMRRAEKERLETVVAARGGTLVALDRNPIDEAWTDRPAAPVGQTQRLDDRWTGESSAHKRTRIAADLVAKGADELLLTSPDSIAWLLNVRGSDIPFNPLCLSYALLGADGTCRWFVDERKLAPDLALENAISVEPQERLLSSLDSLGKSGSKVLVDPAEVHVGFLDRLHAAGARLIEGDNPIVLAKACKNAVEIEGAVEAQIRDGAALVRFLAWLDRQPHDGSLDEIGAARKLDEERARDPLFRGPSFGSISAHGPNAALPHYHSAPESNRPLTGGTLYLIDSGGQYLDATTDVTRTVALGQPSAEMCHRFTLVLKGMIAIATAVFPEGTTGAQLDSFARAALWREGLDFDHGTGHGVGAYLCVHEGPARISKAGTGTALKPGMILSDEPGYYKLGAYGIRIENLVAVEARGKPEGADKNLLGFRTLTLAPIDRRLIVPDLLTPDERTWLDGYHAHVRDKLSPLLGAEDRAWLEAATAAL